MEFSVAEDTGKRENDVSKVVHKFKATLMKLFQKEQQTVIETDFDHEQFGDDEGMEQVPSSRPWYGTFDDAAAQSKCRDIANYIEEGLKLARENHLKCEILIPCGLTMRVAQDILIMSESEPCGVRGCTLYISLKDKTGCSQLVKFECDPSTVSTFEIHLTLQEDTRSWSVVKKTVMSITGCFKNSVYRSTPRMLCLAYKLEKLKLYRAAC